MKVSILDDYHDTLRTLVCFEKLKGHDVEIWNDHVEDVDTLAERLKDTEALVLIRERTRIRAPLLDRLDKLQAHQPAQRISAYRHRCLHRLRRDRVLEPARGHAVVCRGGVDLGVGAVCDAADPTTDGRAQSRGNGRSASAMALRGKTLGIYGYGRIGSVVAGYGKAFGMNMLVWAREASLARARADGYATAHDKQAFFEDCDVVSLHMRLVEATRGIVTPGDLARMKPTALLVNTSRAPLIEHGALERALKRGTPRNGRRRCLRRRTGTRREPSAAGD